MACGLQMSTPNDLGKGVIGDRETPTGMGLDLSRRGVACSRAKESQGGRARSPASRDRTRESPDAGVLV